MAELFSPQPLNLLLVDDEAPARQRLRELLSDFASEFPTAVQGEAGNGVEALALLDSLPPGGVDAVLVDIRMPTMDGLQFALHVARRPAPPAVIFITAFDQYAVKAFELTATDYLLKPVRAGRLQEALRKVKRSIASPSMEQLSQIVPEGRQQLRSVERGRVIFVPVAEVLYFKAEQKYVIARTLHGEFLLEESLTQLENELGPRFIRVHRNSLVARAAIVGYERAVMSAENGMENGGVENPTDNSENEARWCLLLRGLPDKVVVSRRQWPILRAVFYAAKR